MLDIRAQHIRLYLPINLKIDVLPKQSGIRLGRQACGYLITSAMTMGRPETPQNMLTFSVIAYWWAATTDRLGLVDKASITLPCRA